MVSLHSTVLFFIFHLIAVRCLGYPVVPGVSFSDCGKQMFPTVEDEKNLRTGFFFVFCVDVLKSIFQGPSVE